METFKIPVTYSVYGHIEIEANTLEDAWKYAKNNIDELPLADEPEYVYDSYEVEDLEIAESIN